MNVKELKKEIANLPDDMEVILQRDPEGNGYSPIVGVEPNAIYINDGIDAGTVYLLDWTAKECCLSEEKWKKMRALPKSLIIHPLY